MRISSDMTYVYRFLYFTKYQHDVKRLSFPTKYLNKWFLYVNDVDRFTK